jgi:hypothetical protein
LKIRATSLQSTKLPKSIGTESAIRRRVHTARAAPCKDRNLAELIDTRAEQKTPQVHAHQ